MNCPATVEGVNAEPVEPEKERDEAETGTGKPDVCEGKETER